MMSDQKRNFRRSAMGILVALCIFGLPAIGTATDVLVVHSYHAQYDWVQGIDQAIGNVLGAARIDVRTVYMDTKRHPSRAFKIKAGRQAEQAVADIHPKVVIAVDDNAQSFFVADSRTTHAEIQFIFCGVNAAPESYGYPAANVTGILERAYPDQVLALLKMIVPQVTAVAYVSDDSATANLVLPRIQRLANQKRLPVAITGFDQPATFAQWRQTIRRWDKDDRISAFLIPLYHTVKADGTDISMSPSAVMAWTVSHTAKPVVGFWPFSTDDGALAAVVVDPREHGRIAALMARQVIKGKTARQLPMVTNRDGFVIVNLKTAARLGIDMPFEVLQSADKIIE